MDYGSALDHEYHRRFLRIHNCKNSGKMYIFTVGEEDQIANGVAGQDIVDEEDVMCTSIMAVFADGGDVLRRLAGARLCRRHIARRL